MIYPERMERISIVAPQKHMKRAIEILHNHGVLHIIDHRKDELDIGSPLPESNHLADELIRTRSIMHNIGIIMNPEEQVAITPPTGELASQLTSIEKIVNENRTERKKLDERLSRLTNPSYKSEHKERDLELVQRGIEANEAQVERLREKNKTFLLGTEAFLAVEARKAQAPLRFAVTKHSFVANGWVPKKNLEALRKELDTALNKEVYLETKVTKEDGPIKLHNSEIVSPFETLLKLYTLPKYNEIDPTTFLFLSFPIFFGFILGDIGYGLVLLIMAFIMRATSKTNKFMRSVANILIMSSVATVVFGAVFGEFFGLESIGSYEIPHLLTRAHDITTLLMVSIGIGVIHISIALIVGFVNELHHHGSWKAFCAKLSWLILLVGVGLMGASIVLKANTLAWGGVITALAVILIAIGEGVRGIIELPGIFSNIMSYARLMAVGVASAALAVVINEMAGTLIATGSVANFILALVIIIVGHIVNFGLGIFGGFIHGLRLHYVEFFSKFYEGGGKPYKPFGGS